MKILTIFVFLIGVIIVAEAQNVLAQGAPSSNMQMVVQISEARKANAALMRQYTWNCRTEVFENNEVKDTSLSW